MRARKMTENSALSIRQNIEVILDFLSGRDDVRKEVFEALEDLVQRAERAERQAGTDGEFVSVKIPATRRKAHTRQVRLVDYTLDCPGCGQTKTFSRYPGPAPRFCPECQEREEHEAKLEAQRRWRAKKSRAALV